MAEEAGRPRLGRGLAALIGDVGEERPAREREAPAGRSPRRVPIELLKPNPRNPRRHFAQAELDELAESIRQRGVLQPILVRTAKEAADCYEIIAGERRWRAAQAAGLHEVPVVVLEATDKQSLEYAIIENVQREDLNPIEEAEGYAALGEQFGYSADEIAKLVGKSRPHVANTMRLLKLSDPVKQLVRSGALTAGHARLLVGQPNALEIAQEIIDRGLNVRQVEAMARADGAAQARRVRQTYGAPKKDADTLALEKRVSDVLGLQVSVEHKPGGSGTLHIHYRNLEQLEDVLKRLGAG
ncbi:MAG TPA: ParB/RepB/Spo0J family partition protein [Xanthobacteraceae bacterium]|nr:ParB/RepB/Spo0J family partition protein [Xanthobacteraceae bacterium]